MCPDPVVPVETSSPGAHCCPGVVVVKQITISTRQSPRRWFWVVIHPDITSLQDAAHRYRPHHGRGWWDGCAGCCHPVPDRYDTKTETYRYPTNGFAGVLRFAATHLTSEITAHELIHAACAVYRMNTARYIQLGDECGHREETLAYLYGELYASLTQQLPKAGYEVR